MELSSNQNKASTFALAVNQVCIMIKDVKQVKYLISQSIQENQNNVTKKEEVKSESNNSLARKAQQCLQCNKCDFLSFFQISLVSHNCSSESVQKVNCPGCSNKFASKESFSSHLLHDHYVSKDEIENFIKTFVAEKPKEKIHIVDHQLLKKPDTSQPKSKIFIKDVTLLRKPDLLHNDIAIPNIFDSLDLTTTDDDIFDDFLGSDDQIFDDDFDFEESANLNNIESFPTPEPTAEVEVVEPVNPDLLSGKIFVRKNLCNEDESVEVAADPSETTVADLGEVTTSKIFVRSHESLTSQVLTTGITQQPSEASTPDCIIVSSEIISPAPSSKIFIRNLETLTNAVQDQTTNQFFAGDDQLEAVAPESYLNLTNYPPIYVRSYDSLVNDSLSDTPDSPRLDAAQSPQPRCKISIKNMNTLIEPILMQPPLMNPSSMIFGQAQNLVIHMRPQQPDESLLNYRDTSVTPDTLPTSSNVSTCGGNDEVIILDDCEMNDTIFSVFDGTSEIQNDLVHLMDPSLVPNEIPEIIDNPERIETPNEKTVLQKLEIVTENIQLHEENLAKESEQPMVRIPIDFIETVQEPERKKVKIIKIIRIKKKKEKSFSLEPSATHHLNNIQVVFRCSHQDCNQNFTSEQLLNYHRKCHSGSGLVCPECSSEEFKSLNTLHTHLWRSHKVDIDLYACNLCDFKTPILSRLKNFHSKIHSVEKNFKCLFPKCGKSFKNSKQLKNHSQIHKKKVKLKTKTISDDSENSKRIKCGECNKGFSSESGLYIHSMEHKTDEKKFNCEECEYSTNDHNSFRRHKSQHSMVHHYKCPACEYSSIQSNTYRKHLEKQHPELAESLLHKCALCRFTTISKGKFDGHMMKHDENDRRGSPGKKANKIKVKSISLLTDPIHCNVLMQDLLPNQDDDL